MREVTLHRCGAGIDELLSVGASEENTNHYVIGVNLRPLGTIQEMPQTWLLRFQQGPLGDDKTNVNGLTLEAVIAVCIDRLTRLNGEVPCPENIVALCRLEDAMRALHARTRARNNQGVEGTMSKHASGAPSEVGAKATPGDTGPQGHQGEQGEPGLRVSVRRSTTATQLVLRHKDSERVLGVDYVKDNWKAWGEIESVVRHYHPRLTSDEWAVLEGLATKVPSKNGLAELKSALLQAGKL